MQAQAQDIRQKQNEISERFQRGGVSLEEAERLVDELKGLNRQKEQFRRSQFEAMAQLILDEGDAFEPPATASVTERLRQFCMHILQQLYPELSVAELQCRADALTDIDLRVFDRSVVL